MTSKPTVFVRKTGDPYWCIPEITGHASEADLQRVIEEAPQFLPGVDGRGMVVVSELNVPNIGFVDLVGVDPAGTITLVECKLKRSSEIRRTIVGQVFAYAAGLWQMSYEVFDEAFSARARKSLAQSVAELVQTKQLADWNEEQFRSAVAEKLASGRFKIVIAVDDITEELRRIVLYINTVTQLDFLAVELPFYSHSGIDILMPVLYGEEAVEAKTLSRFAWDETSFFAKLHTTGGAMGADAVWQLYKSSIEAGGRPVWGTSPTPTLNMVFRVREKDVVLWGAGAYTVPSFDIRFDHLKGLVSLEDRKLIAEDIQAIPGVTIGYQRFLEPDYSRRPELKIGEVLVQPGAVTTIMKALKRCISSVANGSRPMANNATAEVSRSEKVHER